MITATLSILVLTILVYGLNKKLPVKICAICAGVTLTWFWMLLGMGLGFLPVSRYEFIVAILMGATIGGIVTELKKAFLKWRSGTKSSNIKEIEKQLDDCC